MSSIRRHAWSVQGALLMLVLAGCSSAAQDTRAVLEKLGGAYAADVGTALTATTTGTPVSVTAENQTALVALIVKALVVGVVPRKGEFESHNLEGFPFPITMAAGRSPRAAVEHIVTPGSIVVPVNWTFRGSKPVASYAVMSRTGEPLFDALLSLPVIPAALLSGSH